MSDEVETSPVGTSRIGSPPAIKGGVSVEELHTGAEIHCRMKSGPPISGEIISHEKNSNVVIIQQVYPDGATAKQRIVFVNLLHVEMIDSSPANSTPPRTSSHTSSQFQPHPPDREALEEARRRLKREERKCSALWLGDAPPGAVKTFVSLKKIYPMTVWDGANIRVLKDVIVKEPYDETNVECTSNQRSSSIQAVEQVRKVLSQFARGKPP